MIFASEAEAEEYEEVAVEATKVRRKPPSPAEQLEGRISQTPSGAEFVARIRRIGREGLAT